MPGKHNLAATTYTEAREQREGDMGLGGFAQLLTHGLGLILSMSSYTCSPVEVRPYSAKKFCLMRVRNRSRGMKAYLGA